MAAADSWLVVGAEGQIGRALCHRLQADGQPVIGTSRREGTTASRLDFQEPSASWCLPERVAVCYLCAAVTSVERCQNDPDGTRLVNVHRTLELALRLHEQGTHVVFLSTNQVFDGAEAFRSEVSPPSPRTEYGRQKAAVEQSLLELGNATVVRFTKVVGPQMPLIREWVESLVRREPITAFDDMVMSPVPLGFTVEVLARVGQSRAPGVFHVSGDVDVTYAAVARRVADRLGAPRDLVRVASFAARNLLPEMAPAHTTLDGRRVRRELGLQPPAVESTLDDLIEAAISAVRMAGSPDLSLEAPWAAA